MIAANYTIDLRGWVMSDTVFKVIIAGSRAFNDYDILRDKCDSLLVDKKNTPNLLIEIVSGAANGADKLGERYAKERGFLLSQFKADWEKLGKKAGYLRNVQMADYADALIAFDVGTKGTGHMIQIAKQRGMLVRVVKVKPTA